MSHDLRLLQQQRSGLKVFACGNMTKYVCSTMQENGVGLGSIKWSGDSKGSAGT